MHSLHHWDQRTFTERVVNKHLISKNNTSVTHPHKLPRADLTKSQATALYSSLAAHSFSFISLLVFILCNFMLSGMNSFLQNLREHLRCSLLPWPPGDPTDSSILQVLYPSSSRACPWDELEDAIEVTCTERSSAKILEAGHLPTSHAHSVG